MDGWVGIGMRVMGNKEEIRAKMEVPTEDSSCPRLLPSAALMKENKQNRQEQISGVYPSHCFIDGLQVEISAAEGDSRVTISAKPQEPKTPVCERGHREGLGDPISGERRWHCFQSVCKNTCPTTAGT